MAPFTPRPIATYTSADEQNPARRLAFWAAWMLVFIRFSLLHQFASYLVRVNLYLLALFGIPALFGLLITGGFRRTWDRKPGRWMTAWAVWLVITLPFSTWRGDSFHIITSYWRSDFLTVFIVAGLALTWKDCERLLVAAAFGGCVQLIWARMFDTEQGDRMGLTIGSLGNSNDYAAHMILALAFVFWLGQSDRMPKIIRMGAYLALLLGTLLIVRTASRGALVAMMVVFLIFLYRATMAQRFAVMMAAPIILTLALISVPKTALTRITSFTNKTGASAEAMESSNSREYLLRKSIEYTFTHPIFGVGVGQFASFEGSHNKVIGGHGEWHNTHNTFTQVSSETGFIGLFLFLGTVFSIIGTFRKINATARRRPDCQDIALASFCAMVAAIGFTVAVTFLSFAYFFYFPFLAGLAVAMSRAADREFQDRKAPAAVAVVVPRRGRIIHSHAEVAPA